MGIGDEGSAIHRPSCRVVLTTSSVRPRSRDRSMITISAYESGPCIARGARLRRAGRLPAERRGRPLVVVASGDTAGWIVPCGCTSNQSGGLPRRATYIEGLRRRGGGRRRSTWAGPRTEPRPTIWPSSRPFCAAKR